MTGLPPEITDMIAKQEPVNLEHRWGFSIVPARLAGFAWESGESKNISEIGIYLAGHCRDCNKAITVPLPFGTTIRETQLEIPRFGCVDPRFVGI